MTKRIGVTLVLALFLMLFTSFFATETYAASIPSQPGVQKISLVKKTKKAYTYKITWNASKTTVKGAKLSYNISVKKYNSSTGKVENCFIPTNSNKTSYTVTVPRGSKDYKTQFRIQAEQTWTDKSGNLQGNGYGSWGKWSKSVTIKKK